MKGLRKAQLILAWFWYSVVEGMTLFAQVRQHEQILTSFSFWVCIVLNVVMFWFAGNYKDNIAGKNRIRKFSRVLLTMSDSRYQVLTDYDVLAVFVITLVDMFLYIRPDGQVFTWMINFIFVVGIVLMAMSYIDRKYGPKELTRKEKLEQRRAKRAEREAAAVQMEAAGTPVKVNTAVRSSKPKKKYKTSKRK